MKLTQLIITLLLCLPIIIKAQSPITYERKDGDTHFLGTIDRSDLNKAPHKEWLDSIYNEYEVERSQLEFINTNYDDEVKIKIFMGTWCGDSKREVSRFFKILDHSKMDPSNISIICLDNRRENYKQGPDREEKGYGIHRVPTFIFEKENKEIGRVVEFPVNKLETDIAQIYAGLPSTPNYKLANEVGQLLEKHSVEEASAYFQEHLSELEELSDNAKELSTYGFVLLAAEEYDKAKLVLKFNSELFPEDGYAMYCKGRAHMLTDENAEALACFTEAMELGGDYGYSIGRIKELLDQALSQ